ncbi:Gfo/Idh/MocA family protein [Pseudactinotalea sp. Z1748]|uniref:Gfo/Idh/MocA family protein n=1 Tax=Pseudactinotalea sp. Z1748 TaxID=3413027 RepID=UPI003C7D0CFF
MSATDPARIVLVGAGGMGGAWLRVLSAHPQVQVVGVVDLDLDRARDLAHSAGADVSVARTIPEFDGGADAIVNATVPQAHLEVSVAALERGMAVLCEKPAAPTIAEAIRMAAAAQVHGRLLMVSQSRRYGPGVAAFFEAIRAHQGGSPGLLVSEFFRAPRFGGFRERMRHVLLVDMAIHAFDTARLLTGADPVAVYCDESNQDWSWFDHDASASAIFEFTGAARYLYTGSWIAAGAETSWNARWRSVGAGSTIRWDGQAQVTVHTGAGEGADDGEAVPVPPAAEGIEGALEVFLSALVSGQKPLGEVRENIASLAMVEAAVRSARTRQRVRIADVLTDGLAMALRTEDDEARAAVLAAWSAGDGAPVFGSHSIGSER